VLAGIACAAVIVIGAIVPSGASATRTPDTPVTTLDLPLPLLAQDPASATAEDTATATLDAVDDTGSWSVVSVRSGQTVGDIFHQNGLNPAFFSNCSATQQCLGPEERSSGR
jgi:hypothetical protein